MWFEGGFFDILIQKVLNCVWKFISLFTYWDCWLGFLGTNKRLLWYLLCKRVGLFTFRLLLLGLSNLLRFWCLFPTTLLSLKTFTINLTQIDIHLLLQLFQKWFTISVIHHLHAFQKINTGWLSLVPGPSATRSKQNPFFHHLGYVHLFLFGKLIVFELDSKLLG